MKTGELWCRKNDESFTVRIIDKPKEYFIFNEIPEMIYYKILDLEIAALPRNEFIILYQKVYEVE